MTRMVSKKKRDIQFPLRTYRFALINPYTNISLNMIDSVFFYFFDNVVDDCYLPETVPLFLLRLSLTREFIEYRGVNS